MRTSTERRAPGTRAATRRGTRAGRLDVLTVLLLAAQVLAPGAARSSAQAPDLIRPPGNPPWRPSGYFAHPPIGESSGIVASRRFPGVYWTLNDSGNPPVLYATAPSGELLREFPVQGATNRDWEDLAIDAEGRLWVGDIGNNSRRREDLCVYLVSEPDPSRDSTTQVLARYPFRYPGQAVDAEGMFVLGGLPCIVSKEQGRAVLYRLPALLPDLVQDLQRVGLLAGASVVTGAALSADGLRLALCTYDALWVYHANAPDLQALLQGRPWTLAHAFETEAIGFDGHDLILTSENRNLYHLPRWWYEGERPLPPLHALSAFDLLASNQVKGGRLGAQRYRDAGLDMEGGHLALRGGVGASLCQTIEVPRPDQYGVCVLLTRGPEYGLAELRVDGATLGQPRDCNSPVPVAGFVTCYGSAFLAGGPHQVELRLAGLPPGAAVGTLGLDSYVVRSTAPFARPFLVLGPFPKARIDRIDTPLPPEQDLGLDAAFTVLREQPIRWQTAQADTTGLLDFNALLGDTPVGVAYALTWAFSKQDRGATLLVGSDDQVAVWLDGQEVHRHEVGRGAEADQDQVPVRLRAGWNQVLCKVGQNGGGWGVYLRFNDPDGSLRYTLRPAAGQQ